MRVLAGSADVERDAGALFDLEQRHLGEFGGGGGDGDA